MRIVSKRPTTKQEKEQAKGILPARASPAATPSMFDSAMPRLKARSGCALAKPTVMVDFERSASRVTIRSSRAPSSTRASPNAARVALAGMIVPPLSSLEGRELGDHGADGGVGVQARTPAALRDSENLADGADRLGGFGRLAMPLRVVLHEGDALALDGVGDDCRGHSPRGLGLIEGLADLIHPVAVDLEDRPAIGLPLAGERLEVEDPRHEAVELDLVVVDDDGEIVEGVVRAAELRGGHGRLPYLTLLDLAVPDDAVDACRRPAELEPQSLTQRDGEPLPERSGGGLHAGQGHAIRVPLERRAEFPERDELGFGKVARPRHGRVEGGDGVSLRQDEPVAIGPFGVRGIVPHAPEEEGPHQVDDRQRPTRMTRAGMGQHANDLHATIPGDGLEPRDVRHESSSMKPAIASTWIPDTATAGA